VAWAAAGDGFGGRVGGDGGFGKVYI
jgi:hypothetical protein